MVPFWNILFGLELSCLCQGALLFLVNICVCVCVCTLACATVMASRDRDRLKNLAQELKKKKRRMSREKCVKHGNVLYKILW